MKGIKIILFIVMCLVLPSAQFVLGQVAKKVSKKTILKEIEKSKKAYYSNTVFRCSVQQLKEGIIKYFENRKGFSYNYDTYNRVCYTTYYTRRVREYVVCSSSKTPNPNEPALCLISGADKVRYILYFDIIQEGDSLFKVEVDEVGDRLELYRRSTTTGTFKYNNLIHFLNEYIYSKWQPSQELQSKIDSYNNNVLRAKRIITEGKDY